MSGQPRIDEFLVTIRNWQQEGPKRGERAARGFFFEVARAIATQEGRWGPGTPRRSGFAANSWRIGINSAPEGPSDPKVDGVGQPDSFSELAAFQAGDTVFLASACVYMPVLEGGWSKQAPVGMIDIVLSQSQLIMDTVVAQLDAAEAFGG